MGSAMSDPTVREIEPGETATAVPALQALRPHHPAAAALVTLVDDVLRPQGYRLAGSFVHGEAAAAAVAGFRVMHMLAHGRLLYVDDLSTRPEARRRGHGAALMRWLLEESRRQGCASLQLDSGVQEARQEAHRLYFNSGMRIASYHFSRRVESSAG